MKATRRGITLIEITTVAALMSVVMVLATTTLTTLFRLERQISGDLAQEQNLSRLASRVRADCHEAATADVNNGLLLTCADGRTIQYQLQAPQIVREIRRDATTLHRDAFTLPSRAEVQFRLIDENRKKLVRVSVMADSVPSRTYSTPVRAATIDAALDLYRTSTAGAKP